MRVSAEPEQETPERAESGAVQRHGLRFGLLAGEGVEVVGGPAATTGFQFEGAVGETGQQGTDLPPLGPLPGLGHDLQPPQRQRLRVDADSAGEFVDQFPGIERPTIASKSRLSIRVRAAVATSSAAILWKAAVIAA